jgi:hypothetical protein
MPNKKYNPKKEKEYLEIYSDGFEDFKNTGNKVVEKIRFNAWNAIAKAQEEGHYYLLDEFIPKYIEAGLLPPAKLIFDQVQFKSQEEFEKRQNNFYFYFLEGRHFGEIARKKPHFERFGIAYPNLEKETTEKTLEARANKTTLPFKLLFKTYPLMSQFVFKNDELVKKGGAFHNYLLG